MDVQFNMVTRHVKHKVFLVPNKRLNQKERIECLVPKYRLNQDTPQYIVCLYFSTEQWMCNSISPSQLLSFSHDDCLQHDKTADEESPLVKSQKYDKVYNRDFDWSLYPSRMSRIEFVSKSMCPRTKCINLVLNLTSYDSISALMLFIGIISEANENPRIISSNPTHLKQKGSHHRMRKVLQLKKKLVYSTNQQVLPCRNSN